MIHLINSVHGEYMRTANLKEVTAAKVKEHINGEYILNFDMMFSKGTSAYGISDNSIFEANGDYFDLVGSRHSANTDGTCSISVDAEHVSYRLNDPKYNWDHFFNTGTCRQLLTEVLEGTEFSVGRIELDEDVSVMVVEEEEISRRALLMLFTNAAGVEVEFERFKVNLYSHRGSRVPKGVVQNRHINTLVRELDKRELSEDGYPKVSYRCSLLHVPNIVYAIGDEVRVVHNELGVDRNMRITSMSKNPYDPSDVIVDFESTLYGLERLIRGVQTSAWKSERIIDDEKTTDATTWSSENLNRQIGVPTSILESALFAVR